MARCRDRPAGRVRRIRCAGLPQQQRGNHLRRRAGLRRSVRPAGGRAGRRGTVSDGGRRLDAAVRRRGPAGSRAPRPARGRGDATRVLHQVLAVELNAAAENPLVDVAGEQVLHNGNFHAAYLSLALDATRAALYQAAALAVARLGTLVEPDFTGLPAFLAGEPAGSSGVMILEYVAHAALAEIRLSATPVAVGGAVLSRGVEEHASFAPQGADRTLAALEAYRT